ncbi:transcription elongation factor GreAB [Companilactobacillus jidongensis]|uniref:transcription elongation factor GreAB n=1 Tax=Companilactobacillus jidongensis TaxID=2486006 RepID=UPI001CDCBD2D|nr:transcription elongation factor GreAB [Companilactobacillus jidongensis]
MYEVKVVKYKDSLAFKLPKNIDINKNDTWILAKMSNGYCLVPKINNPYKGAKPGSMYVPEEW